MIVIRMSGIHTELLDPDAAEISVAIDARVREEPEDDEEEDEGSEEVDEDEDEANSDGYSE
jgi:hypothetical protein